jgi:hypothetical protein
MRINVSINHVKMLAKRLKRSLAGRGIEMKLAVCQNVVARLYGYAHYNEMQRTQTTHPSVRDLDVDAETAAALRQYQMSVLTQAGFGDVADALLDEIAPIGTYVMKALKDA